MIDLLIRDEGTVVALSPQTEAAREWIDDHVVSESYHWLGNTLVVPHSNALGIINGAMEDGLGVAHE